MNILICPDSFKGTLSAIQVSKIIGEEFEKEGHVCLLDPIADGGEGTTETLLFELGGEKKFVEVQDPFGRKIKAFYGLNGQQAYIEMAESSGLHCLSEEERDPWITSTYGVGQLIKDALDNEAEEIYVGIGGSATNDVGIGMAQALGIRFLDKDGKEIEERKKEGYSASCLNKIDKIDFSQLDSRIHKTKIKVFCDVQNPLYGEHGASYTYSRQKGASEELVQELENSVKTFSEILATTYNIDPNFPGAGAAGGLGAALKIFLGANIVSGIEGMIELLKLEEKIKKTDLVVVGEGQMDFQSMYGKAPIGIAKLAKKFDRKVVAIVGKIGKDVHKNFQYIDHIFSCFGEENVEFAEVKRKSEENLRNICQLALSKIGQLDSYKYQLTILP